MGRFMSRNNITSHLASLCSLALVSILCGCTVEVDTKVKMVDGNNPPTFKLSGTGVRPYFTVRGPYAASDKVAKEEPIWAITPDESLEHEWLSNLPLITYGKVPTNFKQLYPKNGDAPKLEEGKFYNVYVRVLSAEGGGTCFGISQGKAIPCP